MYDRNHLDLILANDWMEKAGAYVGDLGVILPHKFLLIPLTLASEAIIEFRKHDNLGQKIKYGIVVVTMVRIADTEYYKYLAGAINSQNSGMVGIYHNFIRGGLCGTNIKNFDN